MRPAFAVIALALAVSACAHNAHVTFVPPPAEPPPSVDCAPASALNDSDSDTARLNPAELADICASAVQVNDGGVTWIIQRYQSGRPGPLWVVPHDDENSAFISAIAALHRYGGLLVAVDNYGARTRAFRDPNRSFGSAGTCEGDGSGPIAPVFTQEMLRYRFPGQPIIALHTNRQGYDDDGAGGAGNTSILLSTPHRTSFPAAAPYPGSLSPSDTVTFVAGFTREPDEPTARLIAQLNGANINVIYEHVAPAWTDCSLSNFALLAHVAPYINIETVEGDPVTQTRLIDDVMRILAPAVS